MIEVLQSPLQSNMPISNAVKANGMVFTSQIPRDPQSGAILHDRDILTQARQTFANLRAALGSTGADLRNVVQLTIFLVEASDGAAMNEAYREYFSQAPYPNRATVVVKELMVPGMRIELTAQAIVDF